MVFCNKEFCDKDGGIVSGFDTLEALQRGRL